jgi:hypothetical protein
MLGRAAKTLYFLCLLSIPAIAKEQLTVLDSLYVSGHKLFACFHINNLLDDKAVAALQRGLTSEVVHHVQLWNASKILDPQIFEGFYSISIYFDSFSQKFAISAPSEKLLTANLETVRNKCAVVTGYALADSSRLVDCERFYLSIRTTFKPISDQSYFELRDWMAGKVLPEQKAAESKKRGKVYSVLFDLMGFGDKDLAFKSRDFIIDAKGKIVLINK